MSCTPSTPAPARKRRRPNHDLQQRLARCEELLQEYATAKPAGTPSDTTGNSPPEPLPKPVVGQLLQGNNGGVQFMDSYLWANVYDEVSPLVLGCCRLGARYSPPRNSFEACVKL